ncbi:ribonuclease P protein component 1 [Halalkalicoccus ordinarius]|uniref:ribonuclease P protein component 1 n=1 Tax=Halalkalicoccus ordinarius TaxID=3116651 RepID=UPI00300E6EB2
MALTPETLARHELNGLCVRAVAADNPDLVGIGGRVVRETTKTLSIREGSRVCQVPKSGTVFEFELPTDEAATAREGVGIASEPRADRHDGDGATHVTVDGDRLLSRPARRTETTGDSKWR